MVTMAEEFEDAVMDEEEAANTQDWFCNDDGTPSIRLKKCVAQTRGRLEVTTPADRVWPLITLNFPDGSSGYFEQEENSGDFYGYMPR